MTFAQGDGGIDAVAAVAREAHIHDCQVVGVPAANANAVRNDGAMPLTS